jgi:hypothetical protein
VCNAKGQTYTLKKEKKPPHSDSRRGLFLTAIPSLRRVPSGVLNEFWSQERFRGCTIISVISRSSNLPRRVQFLNKLNPTNISITLAPIHTRCVTYRIQCTLHCFDNHVLCSPSCVSRSKQSACFHAPLKAWSPQF